MWVWVDVGVGVWRFQEHDTTRTLRHPHLFHPYCQEHAWVVWVWVHPQVGVGATHTHLLPWPLSVLRHVTLFRPALSFSWGKQVWLCITT